MKASTWLPIFPGFYGTQFDYDLENELHELESNGRLPYEEHKEIDLTKFDERVINDLVYDNFMWDEWKNEVGKQCCSVIEDNCDFIKSIKYERICSPREYNFVNDSIDCEIELDKREFRNWIYANKESVDQYLHDNLTSRDGFMSFHPNNFEDWEAMTGKFRTFSKPYYVGALLDCYFKVNEFDAWMLRDGLTDMWEGAYVNYDAVAKKLLEIAEEENEDGVEEVIIYKDPNQIDLFTNKITENENEKQ
jgi:hypothetical protein